MKNKEKWVPADHSPTNQSLKPEERIAKLDDELQQIIAQQTSH